MSVVFYRTQEVSLQRPCCFCTRTHSREGQLTVTQIFDCTSIYYLGFPKETPKLTFRLLFFRSAPNGSQVLNTHARRFVKAEEAKLQNTNTKSSNVQGTRAERSENLSTHIFFTQCIVMRMLQTNKITRRFCFAFVEDKIKYRANRYFYHCFLY